MKHALFYLALLLISIASCNHEPKHREDDRYYQKANAFKDRDFEVAALPIKPQDIDPNIGPIKYLKKINDDYLIIDSTKSVIVLDNKFAEKQRFNEKNTPGYKAISPHDILPSGEQEFMVYDLTLDKFSRFTLNRTTKLWEYKNSIPLIKGLHGLISITSTENRFIATSLNNIQGKLLVFNLKDQQQKIEKSIGYVPDYPEQNEFMTATEYRSTCTYDPPTKNVFLAHFLTDMLECYDLNGNLKFRLRGPDNFFPLFKVQKGTDYQLFVNTPRTRSAYYSLTSDEKYLYALYSGKTIAEQTKNDSRVIYIFDKRGKPYKKIVLEKDFSAIRAAGGRLYCYNFQKDRKGTYLFYYDITKL